MRTAVLAACAIAGLAVVTTTAQQPFRSQTTTVSIYATVNDRDGRLAPNLAASDFQVLDNGRPVEITVFSSEPQTITMTILLDMSGSMMGRLLWTRDAADRLVDELRGDDRARIGTFGTEVAISPHLTSDKALLKRVLREELWPGGETPLWSSIDAGMTSMTSERGRRVVLVVTDGNNTRPGIDQGDIKKRAVREEFMVYAIAINGHDLNRELADVAAESGGGYVMVRDSENLQAILSDVVNELRQQYVIGFTPAVLDGKQHKLEVKMARSGLTARAPKAYMAGAPK